MSLRPLVEDTPRTFDKPLRVAVFVSGSGSNLQALIEDSKSQDCPYAISLVISNNEKAYAMTRAQEAGVKTLLIPHREFLSKTEFEKALVAACMEHQIEFVVLAGFMRVLGNTFLCAYSNRVINLHPALCPSFPGMNAVRQALEKGVWFTGCTVHIVNEGVDTGPIIAQAVVPVMQEDDEASLSNRIHHKEHALLPAIVRGIARGEVFLDERLKCQVDDSYRHC